MSHYLLGIKSSATAKLGPLQNTPSSSLSFIKSIGLCYYLDAICVDGTVSSNSGLFLFEILVLIINHTDMFTILGHSYGDS